MLYVLPLRDYDKCKKDQLKELENFQLLKVLEHSEPAFILICLWTSKVLIWGILITTK